MTEREREPKTQIFADSPLLLETQAFGGRRKPQQTADYRRKLQIGNFCILRKAPLTCSRPGLLQSPVTPNPQKRILKSEKCPSGTLQNNGPKSQLKCPKSPFLDILIPQKCQNSPDRGQSRKIRFSKSPGSGLKKI